MAMVLREKTTTVLVHEWVTGGGLAGCAVPPSWAAEGRAMRRAIARDFASLPHVRVTVTLDRDEPDDPGPWTVVRVGPGEEADRLASLASLADFTAPIAPESGGALAERARMIARAGGRSLGASPEAIELAGDKLRLGEYLAARGFPIAPGRRVVPALGLPDDAPYPAVLKPIDGAGALDTYLIREADDFPDAARGLAEALLQPFVPGEPRSASFLVGPDGRAHHLGTGRQRVEVVDGRFVYRGGLLPCSSSPPDTSLLRGAVESLAGLLGFVGVDFIHDPGSGRTTLLEINPRATTSLVALAALLPPGVLAGAWLELVGGAGGNPPDLGRIVHARRPVRFEADGTIFDGDPL